ncbi:MAG: nitroreductase family protein, partial [Anaerolineae bacterium]
MEDVIRLPEPERAGGLPIWTVIASRRTVRKYRPMPLDLSTVSQLLWACAGISGGRAAFRTSPSAGARHPAATLLVANNVTGLN